MIIDERYTTYVGSLYPGNTPELVRIETQAIAEHVPVIRMETQSLLRMLLAVKKPQRILEIGTAVGFSALFMAEYAPECRELITIENYEKRLVRARENLSASAHRDRISLIEGDAAEELKRLSGAFDLVFLDAAKGQYPVLLPDLLRLLGDDGLLVADNVLQEGDIIESHYAIRRRDRTIHKRMRDFLYEITHREDLVTTVLTVGDGVSVSQKCVRPAYPCDVS